VSAVKPYYSDGGVDLYLGDCRAVLPELDLTADVAIVDPPYQETSLEWDRWPDGWPAVVAERTRQMWCFGSMRMFLDRRDEFAGWKLAQDVVGEWTVDTTVWEKNAGTNFAADRFKRVHELITHWYQGSWGELRFDPQREAAEHHRGSTVRSGGARTHTGSIGRGAWVDDGTRLVRSVIRANNLRGVALHPTEKPFEILRPLLAYSCPPGGTVLDPTAGSGSTLAVARQLGRRAVGIEADETYCAVIARRLSQGDLFTDHHSEVAL
jgi:site-specific DNA-methyltransferase (adenine-specific)